MEPNVYLEDWKRDGRNRKETEKMNGTFNISSCAQATVCQPPSGYLWRSSSPFCVPDFSGFVLARGTPPAVSCVAVRVRSSYELIPNVLGRISCAASSNIASSLSRRGREAHMEEAEELETHQISGCHSLVDINNASHKLGRQQKGVRTNVPDVATLDQWHTAHGPYLSSDQGR